VKKGLLCSLVAVFFNSAATGDNLLSNGSFESPIISGNTQAIQTPDSWRNATSFPAIQSGSYGVPEYPGPQDGQQYVAIGSFGTLSQNFTVAAAGDYLLTWYDNAGYNSGSTVSEYTVSVTGPHGLVASARFNAYNATPSWGLRSLDLALTTGSYTLQFASHVAQGSLTSLLDNVQIPDREPVDLIAHSMQWDLGYLRCTYELAGGPLEMASTAKLLWANGPTTADIVSMTPAFVQDIPQGSGTVGSSLPIVFTVPQNLLSAPLPGASYLVLVIDPDSQIAETEEGNNVTAVALLDVAAVAITWNVSTGGIDADYRVESGLVLGSPGRVGLYCASGTTSGGILSSTPIAENVLLIPQGTMNLRVSVPASAVQSVVPGTTHILLVLDPDNLFSEANEDNNTAALSLNRTDLIAHSLFVDTDGAWGGYRYEIVGEEAPVGTTLALYWASGKSLQDRIEPHFFTRTLPARQPGQYTIDEPTLGAGGPLLPPVNATHILLVLDPPRSSSPDGDAHESNELNNHYPFPLCGGSSKAKVFGYVATTDRHERSQYGGFSAPIPGWNYRTTTVPRAVRLTSKDGAQERIAPAEGSEGFFIFDDLDPGEYWLQAYSHSGDGIENNHFWAARRTVIVDCQDVVREEFTLKAQEVHLTGLLAGGSFEITGHDVLDALSIAVIAAAPQSIALRVIAETIIADWALEASLAYPSNEAFRTAMESAIIEFEWANGVSTWDAETGAPFEAWDICVRGLNRPKCGILSDTWLHFLVHSPVSLLVEDAAGRRLGRDPISGRTFNEFAGEILEANGGQVLLISPAYSSEYRIHVIGTDEGSYTLTFVSGDGTHSSGVVSSSTPIAMGQLDGFRFLSGLRGSVGPWTTRASLGVPTLIAMTRTAGIDGADILRLEFPTRSECNYWLESAINLDGTNTWQTLPDGPHNSGMIVITNTEPSTFLRLRMMERDVEPIVFAHLSNAPGSAQDVYSTSDPSVVGRVVDLASDGWVLAGFDNIEPSSFVDISSDIGVNGLLSFDRSALEAINGATLMDGLHTLQLLAYDGQTNLQRSFDLTFRLDTQPPTVYFSNSIVDIDTAVAELQVVEHQTLRFHSGAFDDDRIAKVELLTNGVPFVLGSVLPWEDFVIDAPPYVAGENLLSFQIRATDQAGNEVVSDPTHIEIHQDADPPELADIWPADGSVFNDPSIEEVTIRFSESIAQESLKPENFMLFEPGPDGIFNDGNDVVVSLVGLMLSIDDTVVKMHLAPLPVGSYQVRLSGNGIQDRAGRLFREDEQEVVVSEFRVTRFLLTEDFDELTPPNLPSGWTADSGWQTIDTAADSSPNSVFFPAPSGRSDSSLVSPPIFVSETNIFLTFRHLYNTETGYDGCHLEFSLDSGAFQDVATLGGVFLEGGYDDLEWRPAMWTGDSNGFVTTTIALPSTTVGHQIQFKWRYTSDSSVGYVGWYVDSIAIRQGKDVLP